MNLYAKTLLTQRKGQALWRIYGATYPPAGYSVMQENPITIQSAENFTITNTGNGRSVSVPYTLRGLGNENGSWGPRDYIEIDRALHTVTLNRQVGSYGVGTDGKQFKQEAAYSSSWRYSIATSELNMFRDNSANWLVCTHFTGISAAQIRANGGDAIAIYKEGDTYSQLDLRSVLYDTADWLNSWVNAQAATGSPMTVVYALNSMETEDITDTDTGRALLSFPRLREGESLTDDSGLGVELVTK